MDPQAGPWTRCSNILPAPPVLLQVADSSQDEDTDDDSDSDDDDDIEAEECKCRTPCHDEGWGQWCYVQSLTCQVKSKCTAGGAAGSKCVANDPGGPWTRCANLLSSAAKVPQQPNASIAAARVPQAELMGRSSRQVEEVLNGMIAQVDGIRQKDREVMAQLKGQYETERSRLQTQRDAILKRKKDLEGEISKATAEDRALEGEVDRLEGVNRSLHTQLRQLEGFLSSESATLHTSMVRQDKLDTRDGMKPSRRPLSEALQVQAGEDSVREASQNDDSESDQDDEDDES